MLEVKDLDFYYGEDKVLDKVTFTVEKGEFFGIIGPNGSGKTTLLKCLSGLLKPASGSVLLDKVDIKTLKERGMAKRVAVVPQTSFMEFPFTAHEVVLMGRNPHLSRFGMEGKKDFDVSKQAMERTHTWHLATRRVDRLSGGELQRVVIARALAQETEVMLLDEPTAHLDISHQLEILDFIKDLNRDYDTTVLAVFHDLNLAARYCKGVMMLSRGGVASMGTPEEVLTPENIRGAYQVEVWVKKHPLTNFLYVVPVSIPLPIPSRTKRTVHVVCGGGSGARLLKMLFDQGYRVSAGVLNVLDTDFEVAKSLGVLVAEEAPFSQITEEAHERNLGLIRKADVVILADVVVGPGNLKNLEAILWALEHGKDVMVLEGSPFEQRDFTGGRAMALYGHVRERAKVVHKVVDALEALAG